MDYGRSYNSRTSAQHGTTHLFVSCFGIDEAEGFGGIANLCCQHATSLVRVMGENGRMFEGQAFRFLT